MRQPPGGVPQGATYFWERGCRMREQQQAGIWPTTVKVQCRNEPVFEATISFRHVVTGGGDGLLVPQITCPHCARDYVLQPHGFWFSDRPLKVISY